MILSRRVSPPSLLPFLPPSLGSSLAYIQRCSPEEVEALHLDFTVTFEAVGRQEVRGTCLHPPSLTPTRVHAL
jgi:hypothetical protein